MPRAGSTALVIALQRNALPKELARRRERG
jgi:hypothetical protein